jgi:hypothetical protein
MWKDGQTFAIRNFENAPKNHFVTNLSRSLGTLVLQFDVKNSLKLPVRMCIGIFCEMADINKGHGGNKDPI